MAMLRDTHELNATEAPGRGVVGLVASAEQRSGLRDLALVLARSAADSGRRTSLDEVLGVYGRTRESLAALPDDGEWVEERLGH